MHLFQLSELFVGITCSIVILITMHYKKILLHVLWIFFNLSIAIWGIGGFWVTLCSSPDNALVAWKIAHVGVIFIPITFYHVVFEFTQQKNVLFLKFLYFIGLILVTINLFTNKFIPDVEYLFNSLYYARSITTLYKLFFFAWLAIVIYGHVLLIIRYKNTSSSIDRTRVQYFFYAVFTGFIGGIMNFLPIIGIDVYPYGNILIPMYCIIITYAILRFRLMDITLIITRTGIFIAVYSMVLGIPFALAFGLRDHLIILLGEGWWMAPLVSSTILATGGPFIYLYIQKRTEEKLFQEQRRYQTTLRQASIGMGRIKDLSRLLNLIVHIVTRTVRLQHSMVYLNDSVNKRYILSAVRSRVIRFKPEEEIRYSSPIIFHLVQSKNPIVYEEINQKTQDYGDLRLAHLESELRKFNAALVVPSFIDEKLIAIIILGPKVSKQMYLEDDLAVFSILANQAALAIENAQFYEDMKKTHEQLFKAEKMATIGTMADGLSHQINNRLHALGFIAGDVLDTIKLKKNLSMSPELKEVMLDIEHALSRIQDNVAQGGEVVRGLLKYTRKGEEGYSPVELDNLISSAIEMTQFKIKPGEMAILREYGADIPKIKGNFTQLQEVFFNLIDNAYDAMTQRKQEFKEPEYKAVIKITAGTEKNGFLDVFVEDNGIGVKEEDKEKLFTPFFTTKLSSKKGTGLGLYVIQKLIQENHGGKVVYNSKYKKGTRVHLRLPTC